MKGCRQAAGSRLLWISAVGAMVGCQEINWEREWMWLNPNPRRVQPQRALTASSRSATAPPSTPKVKDPPAQPASPRLAVNETPQVAPVEPTARAPVEPPVPAAPTPVSTAAQGVHRLELLGGPADLAPEPGVYRLRLDHAPVEFASVLVERLLPGLGRGGTADRQYLLYQSETVWRLAVQFAVLLDVSPRTDASVPAGAEPEIAFGVGVGMVYSLLESRRPEPQRAAAAERLLNDAAQSERAERPLRWAAAMLAGWLLSDGRFERFDFEGARQHFLVAQQYAEPLSFPNLVAIVARAETFVSEGRPEEAAALRRRIKEEYLLLHETTLYRRVRETVQQEAGR